MILEHFEYFLEEFFHLFEALKDFLEEVHLLLEPLRFILKYEKIGCGPCIRFHSIYYTTYFSASINFAAASRFFGIKL